MEVDILNFEGKIEGKAKLPDRFSDFKKANSHLLHEVVRAYLANQRKGTHSTLTRAEVTGGGKKPWKQKHTGRARAGTSRSPLWRKGGIIFGPKPRSYEIPIPRAKVKTALSQVLAAKAENGDLVVSEKPQMEQAKTKVVSQWLKKLSLPEKSLLVIEKKDENLALASRNLKDFHWIEWKHLHPYHILKARKIVLTPEVVKSI